MTTETLYPLTDAQVDILRRLKVAPEWLMLRYAGGLWRIHDPRTGETRDAPRFTNRTVVPLIERGTLIAPNGRGLSEHTYMLRSAAP